MTNKTTFLNLSKLTASVTHKQTYYNTTINQQMAERWEAKIVVSPVMSEWIYKLTKTKPYWIVGYGEFSEDMAIKDLIKSLQSYQLKGTFTVVRVDGTDSYDMGCRKRLNQLSIEGNNYL